MPSIHILRSSAILVPEFKTGYIPSKRPRPLDKSNFRPQKTSHEQRSHNFTPSYHQNYSAETYYRSTKTTTTTTSKVDKVYNSSFRTDFHDKIPSPEDSCYEKQGTSRVPDEAIPSPEIIISPASPDPEPAFSEPAFGYQMTPAVPEDVYYGEIGSPEDDF